MAVTRVLDIVNTDHAALNFLAHRVALINRSGEFRNDVVCSPGPHLTRVRLHGMQATPLPIPRRLDPIGIARLGVRLVRHLRAHPYTIVHTHNSITGAVGRIAARLAHVPVTVHTTHGFHFHEHMSRPVRAVYAGAERRLARWCDVLLAQSREEVDEIRRRGLRPALGVRHVGNGIDLRRFRARSALPENSRPVILAVGRLEPVKNHVMLFQALTMLRATPRPVVWLVGDGPCRARYEAWLTHAGLADDVRFFGYHYDIPRLTAAADVAVLTSVKEGLPRALMEAAAVGVPAVATDVKGSREVVQHGETGFLVPLNDHAALAATLDALLAAPALRHAMGTRAAHHARVHFDEDRVADRLLDVYRDTLAARGLRHVTPRRPLAIGGRG
jgi:glycosyltransferase involved in cell wall biosynthesis